MRKVIAFVVAIISFGFANIAWADCQSLRDSEFEWPECVVKELAQGIDYSGANLVELDLYGESLGGVQLDRADLSGADLTKTWLVGAKL